MKGKQSRDELLAHERHLLGRSGAGEVLAVVGYPNSYWVAMSNLGFQAVYRIWHEQERFAVDRSYLPDEADAKPRLFESQAYLSSADILGLSVSFEADYPNVVKMLSSAGLSLKHVQDVALGVKPAESLQDDRPFLLAGGTAVTLNPEPLACFFDAMIIGEAEEVLPQFNQIYLQAKDAGVGRQDLLLELARLEGVYVPSMYRVSYAQSGAISEITPLTESIQPRVKKRFVKNLDAQPAATVIQTSETEFRSMFLVEISRGCETGCRFCAASYAYRPVRRRSYSSLCSCLEQGSEQADSIGYVGAAVSSHPQLLELFSTAKDLGKRASLSSVMTHKVTQEFAETLAQSGYKSVALAPETGNQELRFRVGKKILDEQLLQSTKLLVAAGLKTLKLYFMVGLPGENISDVEDIVALVEQVKTCALKEGVKQRPHPIAPTISVSLNPFIPKPWTPFQRQGMTSMKELKKRIDIVVRGVNKLPNCEIKVESPRESYVQAVWSRGDRRLAALLVEMEQAGHDWRWLIKNGNKSPIQGVPDTDFYAHREIAEDELLPWEVVDLGVTRELLEREYTAALKDSVGEEIDRASARLNRARD